MAKEVVFDYPVGVSSGMRIRGSSDVKGLGGKAAAHITTGVNFIQVDVQEISEFAEPGFLKQMKNVIEKLNLRWGMHAEIDAPVWFDSALAFRWEASHLRLHEYMDYFREFFTPKPKEEPDKLRSPEYVDFHITISPAITITKSRGEMLGELSCTPWGLTNWHKFFTMGVSGGKTELAKNLAHLKYNTEPMPKLHEWFKANLLKPMFERIAGTVEFDSFIIGRYLQLLKARIAAGEINVPPEELENFLGGVEQVIRRWFGDSRIDEFYNFEDETINEETESGKLIKNFVDFMYATWINWLAGQKTYEGAIGGEEPAYALIAKYIEFYEPEVWKLFTNKKMKELLIKMFPDDRDNQFLVTDDGKIHLHPAIVAMVAARYIVAHFESPAKVIIHDYEERLDQRDIKLDPNFHYLSPSQKLERVGIRIAFENPHYNPQIWFPGTQRIVHATDMVSFAKAADKLLRTKNLRLLGDFGWWLANGMDPIKEANQLNDGDGSYFIATQVHATYSADSHLTIDLGSDQQIALYKWLRALQEKGMNKAPIVFERGFGQTPQEVVKETVFVMRNIVEQLMQQTHPKKLPPEFFGFGKGGVYDEQRQRVAVRDHAYDPLKGFIIIPEEDWSLLSSRARDMQKLDEWRKGRLR